MKNLLTILFIFLCLSASGQQSSKSMLPLEIGKADDIKDKKFPIEDLPTFGLYGIGNTNTETFNNINSSGKLSGFIRPFKGKEDWGIFKYPEYLEVDFAFNMNASNTDSLLANTFLFPDIGNNSFSANINYNFVLGKGPNYYQISPFFEFANKTIKGRKDDSSRTFYTINTSVGINFQYIFTSENDKVSFAISPYLAKVSVPNPGRKNYLYLFTGDEKANLPSIVNSWGVKTTFQYNNFQIFADFRTVGDSVSFDGLMGFHPNIGILFNAEIFEK